MSTTVNNHPADPGCYVIGHHGQYLPDSTADVAESFGLTIPTSADPRHWRRLAEAQEQSSTPDDPEYPGADEWEAHHSAADDVLDILNDATRGGCWDYEDGELFLLDDDDDEGTQP